MSEIAKCPICGEEPAVVLGDFHHCGVVCESVDLWNRYAVAMELAKATSACSRHFLRDAKQIKLKQAVVEAEWRVLEVFK